LPCLCSSSWPSFMMDLLLEVPCLSGYHFLLGFWNQRYNGVRVFPLGFPLCTTKPMERKWCTVWGQVFEFLTLTHACIQTMVLVLVYFLNREGVE
jgi:hypothetical protein